MPKSFLRADTFRLIRIGKKSRRLRKWRRPRGKHNKLRLKREGHPPQPGVGYGSSKKEFNKIKGFSPVLVHNTRELEKVGDGDIIIIARIGAKKKIEVLKKASERNIPIANEGGKK